MFIRGPFDSHYTDQGLDRLEPQPLHIGCNDGMTRPTSEIMQEESAMPLQGLVVDRAICRRRAGIGYAWVLAGTAGDATQ